MEKNNLRHEHLRLRSDMSKKEVLDKSRRILAQMMKVDLVRQADVIFSYSAFNNEVLTDPLLFNGWQVALPQVLDKKTMVFRLIDEHTDYKKSQYGVLEPINGTIVEPTDQSVIILPGTCFDIKGNRLGYGGGYYDRYLNTYGRGTKIGVCYEHQLTKCIANEPHDVRVDMILTEQALINCRQ